MRQPRYLLVLTSAFVSCTTPPTPQTADGHGHVEPAERHHGEGHRFEDPEVWAARFEDPSRDEWQRPEIVVEALDLSPSSRVADIGAATGYFPVRLAARVLQGRVWGVDIEPGLVRYLNARARREGLMNLFAILGTHDDPLLPEPVDAILIVNTYHHINDRTEYFRRVGAHLNDGGRLVVVDYSMGDHPRGPPESMRIEPEAVREELEAAGYRLMRSDTESLPYQYILVFVRESIALETGGGA